MQMAIRLTEIKRY